MNLIVSTNQRITFFLALSGFFFLTIFTPCDASLRGGAHASNGAAATDEQVVHSHQRKLDFNGTQIVANGTNIKGCVTQEFQNARQDPVGIQGFSFDYHHDDNHIKRLAVQAGIQSTRTNLRMCYEDAAPGTTNDQYKFHFVGLTLPQASVEVKYGGQASSCQLPNVALPPELILWDRITVVRGFELSYVDPDHHINEISVVSLGLRAPYVCLTAASRSVKFNYNVTIGYMPIDKNTSQYYWTRTSGVGVSGAQTVPLEENAYLGLISGFSFKFQNRTDNHLDQLKVDLSVPGQLSVAFADVNSNSNDDKYNYFVDYHVKR